MSRTATAWAWSLDIKPASLKMILLAMADRADEENCCFPSVARLVRDTCLNEKTVQEGINKLIKLGFVVDTGKRRGATQKVRVLQLNYLESPQNRNDPETGVITQNPKVNDPEIGVLNDPEIGVLNDPEIGVQNQSVNQSLNLNNPKAPSQDSLRDAQGGDVDNSAVDNPDLFAGTAPSDPPPKKPVAKKSAKAGYPEWFENLWSQYPPRIGASDKRRALQAANARISEGKTPDDLLAAVDRYAKFVRATGRWGSQFVKEAQTFFGPGGHVDNPWSVPHDFSRKNSVPRESVIERIERQAREVCADAEAGAHGGGAVDADDADFWQPVGGAAGRG